MTIQQVIDNVMARFKSGNSIPVERVHITAAEWDEIMHYLIKHI